MLILQSWEFLTSRWRDFQVRFKRSKRKKAARFVRTPEQEVTRGKPYQTLFQRLGQPETPYRVSTNIRNFLAKLTTKDRTQIRRRKDHRRYNLQRYLSLSKFTHDHIPFKQPHPYVTSLTKLQHSSQLPLSQDEIRFPFPHLLHYKCYFGPATVEEDPTRNDTESLSKVSVSFRVEDLKTKLNRPEREILVDVVGPRRYDQTTDVVTLDADLFPDRNQNAAYLGDLLDNLVQGVAKK